MESGSRIILQRKVDLVTPNSLSPYIGPYVKNEVGLG